MRKSIIILISFFSAYYLTSQEFYNLDFEVSLEGERPRYWDYKALKADTRLDTIAKSGEFSFMASLNDFENADSFVQLLQDLPPGLVQGKELTLRGAIKSDGLSRGRCGLMMMVDTLGQYAYFDDMSDEYLAGKFDWTTYSITLDIPENASKVQFGLHAKGIGRLWFDSFELIIDGEKLTDKTPEYPRLTEKELNWLKENLIPVELDSNGNIRNTEDFINLFSGAEIVGLGESVHGSREITNMKASITEALIRQMDFSVLALETNAPEADYVDEYINAGLGDTTYLMRRLDYWTWDTREMTRMVAGLKEMRDESGRNINFAGVDILIPEKALRDLRIFFTGNIPDYQEQAEQLQSELNRIHNRMILGKGYDIDDETKNLVESIIDELKIALANAELTDKGKILRAKRNLMLARQYLDNFIAGDDKSRYAAIAENIEFLKENVGGKIIFWGHTSAVNYLDGSPGELLRENYGDNYLSAAFVFYEGEYASYDGAGFDSFPGNTPPAGSLEHYLGLADEDALVLDMRETQKKINGNWLAKAMEIRSVPAGHLQDDFTPSAPAEEFDLVFFISASTAAKMLHPVR
jgi:erythromycin esterase